MRSILDYIKVFKNIETYKDPKLRYAKAEFSPVFDPDLEQSEFLRPGETLEDWKPNPFLKPHAEGGRIGFLKGKRVKDKIFKYPYSNQHGTFYSDKPVDMDRTQNREYKIDKPTKKQLEIAEKVHGKKYNKTGIDLWESLEQFERSNIRERHTTGQTSGIGKPKKNMLSKTDFIELVKNNRNKTYNEFVEIIKKYKTKDGNPFTKSIVADRLRDYGLSGSFKKEPPKGSSNIKKAEAEKKRKLHLKETDPTGAKGTKKFQHHHIRQIAGGVPLTTDDVVIINQRLNAQLQDYDKSLNRIAESIQKNNRLALEAMNAKNEGLALDYMKRVDELNNQAEKIVNSAIDKLPKKYKGYVGFNQFTLPTNEYGLPISNEPMIVRKVGGMPISKDAIDLTTLSKKDEAVFRKIVKQQAEAGKIGPINAKDFKELITNSKRGGALLTHDILSKSKKYKKVKVCKTKFVNGGGGLCGKAFADKYPQEFLQEVMKDSQMAKYLKSKEALTAGRSILNSAAKFGRWANPLTIVGGEAWYSTLAGINEFGKGKSLAESVNEGLWFIPGKHSRDLDMLLGPKTKGKAGRNLPVIPNEIRSQFDLLTQLGDLINKEGAISGQLAMQQMETGRLEDVKAKRLWEERFAPVKAAEDAQRYDYKDILGDIQWSKDIITPQIEKRLSDVGVEGQDIFEKWQAADPTGQSYAALQDRIKSKIVDEFNIGKTWDQADPYSGPIWNWIKTREKIPFTNPELVAKQKRLDLLKEGPDQTITKENIPPELIENFLYKFPEYSYIFEGATGGRAGYMGGGIAAIRKPEAIPPEKQGLRSIMIGDRDY